MEPCLASSLFPLSQFPIQTLRALLFSPTFNKTCFQESIRCLSCMCWQEFSSLFLFPGVLARFNLDNLLRFVVKFFSPQTPKLCLLAYNVKLVDANYLEYSSLCTNAMFEMDMSSWFSVMYFKSIGGLRAHELPEPQCLDPTDMEKQFSKYLCDPWRQYWSIWPLTPGHSHQRWATWQHVQLIPWGRDLMAVF